MLEELSCESCAKGAKALEQLEQEALFQTLEEWLLVEVEGIPQLTKRYSFRNFKQAWAFSDQIARLAEEEGHHPSILLEWGAVTLTWWSHSLKGLHKNDFICAAKSDLMYQVAK